MSPTMIRFRCHRCGKLHAVAAGKAGSIAVCPSCFGPLLVPDLSVARRGGIATAEAPDVLPREVVAPVVSPVEKRDAEPATVERDMRVVWGVALGGVVSLIGTMGLVVSLSLLQAARRSGDRLAVAELPATPIVARRQPRPVAPVPGPKPVPSSLPTPAPIPIAAARPVPIPIAAAPSAPIPIAAAPPAPAAPAPAEAVEPRVVRRRQMRDQEELRKELEALPELALNGTTAAALLAQRGVTISPTPPVPVQYRMRRFGAVAIPTDPRPPDPLSRVTIGALPQWQGADATFALMRAIQPELLFLHWRRGDECLLSREPAEKLQTLSRALRNVLAATTTPLMSSGPESKQLRPLLLGERLDDPPLNALRARVANLQGGNAAARRFAAAFPEGSPILASLRARRVPGLDKSEPPWVEPAAVPALLQLLMAERTSTRRVLVDVLGKIPGPAAVNALARLAVFDIALEVRDQAILALRDRPAESYNPILIEGLRYPWPPAADHAAEALVALEDRHAIPSLIELLDRPDPQGPTTVSRYGQRMTVTPGLVKINHLKNCLLCHDASRSLSDDLVRGRVPSPGQPLPPPVQYYNDDPRPGLFVRAEVTYLRQDFSVTQPVADADPWPTQQRFDYVVLDQPVTERLPNRIHRAKKKTPAGLEPAHSYPQRESVLFALRELTGKNPGTTSSAWRDAMQPARPVPADEPAEQASN